jgi:hypothetical protein
MFASLGALEFGETARVCRKKSVNFIFIALSNAKSDPSSTIGPTFHRINESFAISNLGLNLGNGVHVH